jgi:hypothetical protein
MSGANLGRVLAVVAAVSLLGLGQTTGHAQATTVELSACKKIIPQRGFSPGFTDSLTTRECGNRFTAADPYVAILITLRLIRESLDIGFQLLDPSEAPLWAGRAQVTVEAGYYYENYWLYAVLPVAADLRALAAENAQLAAAALRFPGRPARERLGEWTLRVSINRGRPHVLKFTLVAAPGTPAAPTAPAPPAEPTPAPSPVPSPSPSP